MPCDGPAKGEFAGVCFGGVWTSMFQFLMDGHVAKDLLPNCLDCSQRLLRGDAEEACSCGQWKYEKLQCSWTQLDRSGVCVEAEGSVSCSILALGSMHGSLSCCRGRNFRFTCSDPPPQQEAVARLLQSYLGSGGMLCAHDNVQTDIRMHLFDGTYLC